MSRFADARRYGEMVREKWRFALRERSGRRVRGVYHPRGADVRVVIRHGTGDPWVLHETWRSGEYVPPPPAEEILRACRPLRFVELGGHVGLFGALVLARYPGALVTSFEPDPASAAVLRECIRLNGVGGRWELVEACAGAADGRVELPMVDALPRIQGADFVKFDLEGSEWPILADPRFAADPPRVVLMEWHSPGAPEDNAKRAAVAALEPLGFRIHHPPPFDAVPLDEPLWGAGVLWAWRDA